MEQVCSNGALIQDRACELGCNGDRCRVFTPFNLGSADLLGNAGGAMSVTVSSSYSTTTCANAFGATATATGNLCILRAQTVDVAANLRVTGTRALILVGIDGVRVSATLDVGAAGANPGPGGFAGGTSNRAAGSGPGAGGGGLHAGSYDDGGGGGGGNGGAGGQGGSGANGAGGSGGAAATGMVGIEPLTGGSGGGAAAVDGRGGGGGGGVQLVSLGVVQVGSSGVIHAGGGGGRAANSPQVSNWGSGGGGGAGGNIVLEAPRITVEGTLASNGGAGAGADGLIESTVCGSGTHRSGGPGGDALAGVSAAMGGMSGGGCGARGGDGSSRASFDGETGDSNTDPSSNGGGGGGGAGRLVLRSQAGGLTLGGAVFSPQSYELGSLVVEP